MLIKQYIIWASRSFYPFQDTSFSQTQGICSNLSVFPCESQFSILKLKKCPSEVQYDISIKVLEFLKILKETKWIIIIYNLSKLPTS